jgi:hypothetical protein
LGQGGHVQECPVMSQMRMMTGIGTPISQSRQERMGFPETKGNHPNARRRRWFP